MTGADENDQRTPTSDDIPRAPPEPPPSFTSPDEPARRQTQPPSVELEGERRSQSSFEDARNRLKKARNTSEHERESSEQDEEKNSPDGAKINPSNPRDEADASPVQRTVEDVGKSPKNPHNALKCVRKHSEPKEEMNSPSRPREEPEEPGAETAVPGDFQRTQEHPESVRNKRVGETDAPG